METISKLQKELEKLADSQRAKNLSRFFKCGKGEYGEGDQFLGITVPKIRKLVRIYGKLDFPEIEELLHSKFHEERLLALLILVEQFQKANPLRQKEIFNYYLANTKYINNWDLVDLTAPKIVGQFVTALRNTVTNNSLLLRLAKSKNLWERRIAVLATFALIKDKQYDQSLRIAELLLNDRHDLIHKAVGWMLREIGKRDPGVEEEFLKKYSKVMPRTMLRYAIEKFPEKKRQEYLHLN